MPKDGWDLGILIRLKRWERKLSFNRVRGELISEVGWLKGGDDELEVRLQGLIDESLVTKEDHPYRPKSFRDAYFDLTQEGRDYIHG